VTSSQPPSQPPSHPASHVAVAITLYAKASSAKNEKYIYSGGKGADTLYRRIPSKKALLLVLSMLNFSEKIFKSDLSDIFSDIIKQLI